MERRPIQPDTGRNFEARKTSLRRRGTHGDFHRQRINRERFPSRLQAEKTRKKTRGRCLNQAKGRGGTVGGIIGLSNGTGDPEFWEKKTARHRPVEPSFHFLLCKIENWNVPRISRRNNVYLARKPKSLSICICTDVSDL